MTNSINTSVLPAIYVACLASYNDGWLHGEWVRLINEEGVIDRVEAYQRIEKILSNSPMEDAEEWAIHDFEGFGDYEVEEYTSVEELLKVCEFIAEDSVKFECLSQHLGLEEIETAWDDAIIIQEDDWTDWVNDFEQVEERIQPYFNYQKYLEEMDMGGTVKYAKVDGDIYYIWN